MNGASRHVLVCATVAVLAAPTLSAETLVIDLAEQPPGSTETRPVVPGQHSMMLVNRLPHREYAVSVALEHEDIPPLDLNVPRDTAPIDPCQDPDEYLGSTLDAAQDEVAIRAAVATIRFGVNQCAPDVRQWVADQLSALTTRVVQPAVTVEQGQRLTVTIQRRDEDGQVDATWVRVYSTGARGQWRTGYGFNFIPNNDERYYTEVSEENPGTFVIRREADRQEFDFAPSIFFSWYPNARRGKSVNHSLVAGLGFDFNNPVVFVGYGATIHENITVTGGVVAHQQLRLAGRFHEGEEIGTNLDNSQLTEATYAANFYLGVAFRFGSNPFQTGD